MLMFGWLAMSFMMVASNVLAAESRLWDVELTPGTVSHHYQAPPRKHEWVEENPGIGLRLYGTSWYGAEPFLTATYIQRNSTGGRLLQGGIGVQYPLATWEKFDFLVGGVVGGMWYENAWKKKGKNTVTTPLAYPFLGLRYEPIALYLGFIPEVRGKTVPTAFVHGGIRLPF